MSVHVDAISLESLGKVREYICTFFVVHLVQCSMICPSFDYLVACIQQIGA